LLAALLRESEGLASRLPKAIPTEATREASRCQGKSSGRSEVKRFAWLCAGFAPALLWLSFGAAVALKRAFE